MRPPRLTRSRGFLQHHPAGAFGEHFVLFRVEDDFVRKDRLVLGDSLRLLKQPKAVSQDKTVFADKIILYPEEDKMLTEGASRVMLQKAP